MVVARVITAAVMAFVAACVAAVGELAPMMLAIFYAKVSGHRPSRAMRERQREERQR